MPALISHKTGACCALDPDLDMDLDPAQNKTRQKTETDRDRRKPSKLEDNTGITGVAAGQLESAVAERPNPKHRPYRRLASASMYYSYYSYYSYFNYWAYNGVPYTGRRESGASKYPPIHFGTAAGETWGIHWAERSATLMHRCLVSGSLCTAALELFALLCADFASFELGMRRYWDCTYVLPRGDLQREYGVYVLVLYYSKVPTLELTNIHQTEQTESSINSPGTYEYSAEPSPAVLLYVVLLPLCLHVPLPASSSSPPPPQPNIKPGCPSDMPNDDKTHDLAKYCPEGMLLLKTRCQQGCPTDGGLYTVSEMMATPPCQCGPASAVVLSNSEKYRRPLI
ncbi:hypothetical protein TrVGV298_006553 [Trichoderma virens]|nr:hypothetical protein TrVGV298_006553 [Trichoderma virens]